MSLTELWLESPWDHRNKSIKRNSDANLLRKTRSSLEYLAPSAPRKSAIGTTTWDPEQQKSA